MHSSHQESLRLPARTVLNSSDREIASLMENTVLIEAALLQTKCPPIQFTTKSCMHWKTSLKIKKFCLNHLEKNASMKRSLTKTTPWFWENGTIIWRSSANIRSAMENSTKRSQTKLLKKSTWTPLKLKGALIIHLSLQETTKVTTNIWRKIDSGKP